MDTLDFKSIPQIRDLPNPPKQLFFIGKPTNTLFDSCVAIV